jgi:6-phosphofructokinase 1
VIVAEGAQDQHLNKISSSAVKDVLSTRLGLDTRVTVLGHTQRGGSACAYDRWLSTLQGVEAVKAILDMTPESPSPVVIIRENKILRASLMEAVEHTAKVTQLIREKNFDAAMSMRDSEFKEYHDTYRNTATADHPKMMLPEAEVGSKRDAPMFISAFFSL